MCHNIKSNFYRAINTVVYNASLLFVPHEQATTFAWVMSCPYAITKRTGYTRAKFNCPVNVKVYDSNDNDENGSVQVDANGNPLAVDGGKITCNKSLFVKILALIFRIFGLQPSVTIDSYIT